MQGRKSLRFKKTNVNIWIIIDKNIHKKRHI